MPPRNPTTAEAQLERILYILPAAARAGGARIEDLARALGVEPAVLLHDIDAATARAFFQPAGAVDPFTIFIDDEVVRVHAPHEFRRPVRLNRQEALALGLGLRALAADEPERRAEILALAARLEAELSAPDLVARAQRARVEIIEGAEVEVDYEEYALAFDDDGFRGVVADAIEQQRCCTMQYLKWGEAPTRRRIAPYRLVYADGMWYVAAYDLDRGALRFFRMDRALNAWLDEEAAPPAPPELAALLECAPYSASDDIEVTVRYSPQIARWIAERAAAPERSDDGSVVVHHRVADPRWIVRHVLQYGGEAVVEEPDQARAWVGAAARNVLVAST